MSGLCIIKIGGLGSSVVEQKTEDLRVAGSIPVPGT